MCNIAQDTRGQAFNATVVEARHGDRIRVRGICISTAVIDKDLIVEGVGA